jgi:thiamine pyrophosphokinase
MRKQKLKSLSVIITLQKIIRKLNEIKSCKVYTLIKMRNRTNIYILKRKNNLLNLVLINIYKLLSMTLSGARYFLKAVDNYTRKSWVMPLRFRQEAKPTLKK